MNTDFDGADVTRACTRKKAYPTEEIALMAVGSVHEADAQAEVRPYACRRCGAWHIGATPRALVVVTGPDQPPGVFGVIRANRPRRHGTGTVGTPARHHARVGPAARRPKGDPRREARRARASDRLAERIVADHARPDDAQPHAGGRDLVPVGPGDAGAVETTDLSEMRPLRRRGAREEARRGDAKARRRASDVGDVRRRGLREEQEA